MNSWIYPFAVRVIASSGFFSCIYFFFSSLNDPQFKQEVLEKIASPKALKDSEEKVETMSVQLRGIEKILHQEDLQLILKEE